MLGSGFVGSLTAPDVQFGTDTGFNWHPFGQGSFGADITGFLHVASAGTYTFTLDSDDGSQLFIDSSLVIDDGGPHGAGNVSNSALLSARACIHSKSNSLSVAAGQAE